MYPRLTIDLSKIEYNTRALVDRCRVQGIEVIGVTKCCLGAQPVAEAMRAGGVSGIGDSRLTSLSNLAKARISPLIMLRQPMQAEVSEVVRYVDVSLISELDAAILLSKEAASINKQHSIIVMVEAGDLREGILPHELPDLVEKMQNLPCLLLIGLGTNAACLNGKNPSVKSLELLLELSEMIENRFHCRMSVISGGNSSTLRLLDLEKVPKGINQFRIGEGILLGQDALYHEPIGGLYQDAFLLSAEVIEVRAKRVDLGSRQGPLRRQAVVALGRQDVADGNLRPLVAGIETLKTSSDHLVVGLDDGVEQIKVGDAITFVPSYFALLAAMTSPFVNKNFCGQVSRF